MPGPEWDDGPATNAFFRGLDAPQKWLVRKPIVAALGKKGKNANTLEDFHTSVEAAANDPESGPKESALRFFTNPVGTTIDAVNEATVNYHPAAEVDALRKKRMTFDSEGKAERPEIKGDNLDDYKLMGHTVMGALGQAGDKVGRGMFDLVADPLNFIPVGKIPAVAGKLLKSAAAAEKLGPISKGATHLLEKPQLDQIWRGAHNLGAHRGLEVVADAKASGLADILPKVPEARLHELKRYNLDPETAEQLRFLSPDDKAATEGLKGFFEGQGKKALDEDLIDGLAKNPISGAYLPRQYEKESTKLQALFDQATSPGKPGATKSRTADIPLGADHPLPNAADLRTGTMISTYANDIGRAKTLQEASRRLREMRGIPEGQALSDADTKWLRDKLTGGFVGRTVRAFKEEHPVGAKVLDALNTPARVMAETKLLMNPGYFLRNKVQDPLQAHLFGGPLNIGQIGSKTLAEGDPELLKRAIAAGIPLDGPAAAARIDAPGLGGTNSARELNQLFGQSVKPGEGPGVLERINEAIPDKMPLLGSKYAKREETSRKLGLWKAFVDQGLSDEEAAKRTFDALIDFNNKGPLLQAAQKVFPLSTYALKSPAMLAKATARDPGRVSRAAHLFENLRGDISPGQEPGPGQKDYSPLASPPEPFRSLVASAHKSMKADPLHGGSDFTVRSNTPFEALGFPNKLGEAMTTPKDSAAALFGASTPPLATLYELLSGKDTFSGRHIKNPAANAATTMLSPFVPAPLAAPINYASNALGGPSSIVNTYNDKKLPEKTARAKLLDSLINSFTGLGYKETSPVDYFAPDKGKR